MQKVKEQWEKFAREIALDGNRIRAIKVAYPKISNDNAANASATRLLKRPEVRELVVTEKNRLVTDSNKIAAEQLANEKTRRFLSFSDKREILFEIANNKEAKEADRMRAIELDAELTGEGYRPPTDDGKPGSVTNNTLIKRVTVFNTRITTGKTQSISQTQASE